MKKFLDIFILSLLIALILNLFFGTTPEKKEVLTGNILFETLEKSYTIPAGVQLQITNSSTGSLLVNTCDDITLNHLGSNVQFSEGFCKDITIASGEKTVIEYLDEYKSLSNAGQYNFEFKQGDKKHLASFELEHRGSFTKLFTTVFYAPVFNLFVYLISTLWYSLGWAILAITVVIRIILLWPQHKMLVSQKKLQAIQPKIKKIQEEHKGNQQVIGVKLLELYKKEKVNPMGSCGFLIIQMPILLVIYNIILSIKDPSNFFHIYAFQAGFDMSQIQFDFFSIDLLSSGGVHGAILAISVGLIQFIQVKLSLAGKKGQEKPKMLEKKKDETGYSAMMPDPEMMNKFMLYGMPAMVTVFTYTLIAGVGIYWGTSTLFMIFQQLIVNKIINK
ncbi:MAG: YidC/Oxa1 family membrane protein insertase [Candidatus Gracilibacteria bacterium]|nr:YidC/Oxa1 family membrane protein insertase [Candidatus Gracilibacteria bacterium]